MPAVTVLAEHDSPRLRYVLDWLLGERLGMTYRLVLDPAEAAAAAHCISYGIAGEAVSIHAAGLLSETGISERDVRGCEWEGLHALFMDEDSPCDIRFDMLSGIFYLLTRYEEHMPFVPDRHGRYPAADSVLFRGGVLDRPVVDEWVEALRIFLQGAWAIDIPPRSFSFRASYDIDIAWSYQYKGALRTIGAGLRDLAAGKPDRLGQRVRVIRGAEPDPYNAFIWMAAQHMGDAVPPLWFFLAALQPSRFDKNISPRHPRMAALIKAFTEQAGAGLHPSYYSDVYPARLTAEKSELEAITGRPVTISRQHYIRLRFPQTCRALIAAGIREDYSMGYSTHFGFRAGTGSPFFWYDLSLEGPTSLRIHPFAFMDTTGRFDLGLSAEESFRQLYLLAERLIAVHSSLMTVFHNFSLGTDPGWQGWRRGYETFLNKIAQL